MENATVPEQMATTLMEGLNEMQSFSVNRTIIENATKMQPSGVNKITENTIITDEVASTLKDLSVETQSFGVNERIESTTEMQACGVNTTDGNVAIPEEPASILADLSNETQFFENATEMQASGVNTTHENVAMPEEPASTLTDQLNGMQSFGVNRIVENATKMQASGVNTADENVAIPGEPASILTDLSTEIESLSVNRIDENVTEMQASYVNTIDGNGNIPEKPTSTLTDLSSETQFFENATEMQASGVNTKDENVTIPEEPASILTDLSSETQFFENATEMQASGVNTTDENLVISGEPAFALTDLSTEMQSFGVNRLAESVTEMQASGVNITDENVAIPEEPASTLTDLSIEMQSFGVNRLAENITEMQASYVNTTDENGTIPEVPASTLTRQLNGMQSFEIVTEIQASGVNTTDETVALPEEPASTLTGLSIEMQSFGVNRLAENITEMQASYVNTTDKNGTIPEEPASTLTDQLKDMQSFEIVTEMQASGVNTTDETVALPEEPASTLTDLSNEMQSFGVSRLVENATEMQASGVNTTDENGAIPVEPASTLTDLSTEMQSFGVNRLAESVTEIQASGVNTTDNVATPEEPASTLAGRSNDMQSFGVNRLVKNATEKQASSVHLIVEDVTVPGEPASTLTHLSNEMQLLGLKTVQNTIEIPVVENDTIAEEPASTLTVLSSETRSFVEMQTSSVDTSIDDATTEEPASTLTQLSNETQHFGANMAVVGTSTTERQSSNLNLKVETFAGRQLGVNMATGNVTTPGESASTLKDVSNKAQFFGVNGTVEKAFMMKDLLDESYSPCGAKDTLRDTSFAHCKHHTVTSPTGEDTNALVRETSNTPMKISEDLIDSTDCSMSEETVSPIKDPSSTPMINLEHLTGSFTHVTADCSISPTDKENSNTPMASSEDLNGSFIHVSTDCSMSEESASTNFKENSNTPMAYSEDLLGSLITTDCSMPEETTSTIEETFNAPMASSEDLTGSLIHVTTDCSMSEETTSTIKETSNTPMTSSEDFTGSFAHVMTDCSMSEETTSTIKETSNTPMASLEDLTGSFIHVTTDCSMSEETTSTINAPMINSGGLTGSLITTDCSMSEETGSTINDTSNTPMTDTDPSVSLSTIACSMSVEAAVSCVAIEHNTESLHEVDSSLKDIELNSNASDRNIRRLQSTEEIIQPPRKKIKLDNSVEISVKDVLHGIHTRLCGCDCSSKHNPLVLAVGVPNDCKLRKCLENHFKLALKYGWKSSLNIQDPTSSLFQLVVNMAVLFGKYDLLEFMLKVLPRSSNLFTYSTQNSLLYTVLNKMHLFMPSSSFDDKVAGFQKMLQLIENHDCSLLLVRDSASGDTILHSYAKQIRMLTNEIHAKESSTALSHEQLQELLHQRRLYEQFFKEMIHCFERLCDQGPMHQRQVLELFDQRNKANETMSDILEDEKSTRMRSKNWSPSLVYSSSVVFSQTAALPVLVQENTETTRREKIAVDEERNKDKKTTDVSQLTTVEETSALPQANDLQSNFPTGQNVSASANAVNASGPSTLATATSCVPVQTPSGHPDGSASCSVPISVQTALQTALRTPKPAVQVSSAHHSESPVLQTTERDTVSAGNHTFLCHSTCDLTHHELVWLLSATPDHTSITTPAADKEACSNLRTYLTQTAWDLNTVIPDPLPKLCYSVVHLACLLGKYKALEVLSEFGFHPLIHTAITEETPLHMTMQLLNHQSQLLYYQSSSGIFLCNNVVSIVKTLNRHSHAISLFSAKDYKGDTVLHSLAKMISGRKKSLSESTMLVYLLRLFVQYLLKGQNSSASVVHEILSSALQDCNKKGESIEALLKGSFVGEEIWTYLTGLMGGRVEEDCSGVLQSTQPCNDVFSQRGGNSKTEMEGTAISSPPHRPSHCDVQENLIDFILSRDGRIAGSSTLDTKKIVDCYLKEHKTRLLFLESKMQSLKRELKLAKKVQAAEKKTKRFEVEAQTLQSSVEWNMNRMQTMKNERTRHKDLLSLNDQRLRLLEELQQDLEQWESNNREAQGLFKR